MTQTTLEMFREELLRTGGYKTPPERKAPVPRKKGWLTTLGFSWSVFSVFPRCAISEALRRLTTDLWAHYCFASLQKAEKYGTDVIMDGWNNRKEHDGPVVYLANHMSTLETVMLPFVLLTYGPIGPVVKQSLSHLPCLEKAAAHMGLIPIGRKSPREDLATIFGVGVDRIKEGNSILIFAQGTRQSVFARKGWSSIGSKLAEKAGVPVVPIAVKTDMEPTRPGGKGWFKDFGTVDPSKDIRLACGPVLTGTSRELQRASFDWIKSKLDSWGLPTEG
jgi:1-acyl-sn-glycerol-3-phosphate acyltransferase